MKTNTKSNTPEKLQKLNPEHLTKWLNELLELTRYIDQLEDQMELLREEIKLSKKNLKTAQHHLLAHIEKAQQLYLPLETRPEESPGESV